MGFRNCFFCSSGLFKNERGNNNLLQITKNSDIDSYKQMEECPPPSMFGRGSSNQTVLSLCRNVTGLWAFPPGIHSSVVLK